MASYLHSLRGTAVRSDAKERNLSFINEQRAQLIERLLHAAQTGKLAWHDGPLVDVFVPEGTSRLSTVDLDAVDDD